MKGPQQRGATSLALMAVAVMAVCLACDLLQSTSFTIAGWTPGEGRHDAHASFPVSVTFTGEPEQATVENAFSLTEDGAPVPGCFSWTGTTLWYNPYCPLRSNVEYRITVTTDARNLDGVSLAENFERRWSTRPEDGRPFVLSSNPAHGGFLAGRYELVTVTFSEALDKKTYRQGLSVSPDVRGMWNLDASCQTASFVPLEPWIAAGKYHVSVSADTADAAGNAMGQPYTFSFEVGEDRIPPFLSTIEAIDENGNSVSILSADDSGDGIVTENHGWDSTLRIRLAFNEAISLQQLEKGISCDGGRAMRLETQGETSTTAILRFEDVPAWGTAFAVTIDAGIVDVFGNESKDEIVVRMVCDSPGSRPPRFVGIRFPLNPGESNPDDRNLVALSCGEPYATIAISGTIGAYPVGIQVPTSLELYFDTAPGASLDIMSVMDSFRVNATNGAMDFFPRWVKLGGISYAPPHAPWSMYSLARIDGTMVNHANSGIVTFSIASGFKDSRGHGNIRAQDLPLLK
jgi:hypothetical protein